MQATRRAGAPDAIERAPRSAKPVDEERLDPITTADVDLVNECLRRPSPKIVNDVPTVPSEAPKVAVEWELIDARAVPDWCGAPALATVALRARAA